jgi:microcystin degradation protein MlrC
MDVEIIGSGEAMLVSMIRERIGPTVPIAISLDLHANNTYTLAKAVNILYGYRTAPHTDIAETHIRSARLLIQAIEQNFLPWCELIRIPIMLTGETVMTASGLGKEIMDCLPVVEKAEGVWCASYFAGMPWVDCPQNGSSVVVCGTGNRSPGMAAARNLCDMIWENKGRFTIQDLALAPEEAMDYAASKTDGPVFVSDTADDVTAGATGDNSRLLDIIIKKGLSNVLLAGITDAKAVDACAKAGVGGTISVMLGGSIDKTNSIPVPVSGIVWQLRKNREGHTDGAVLRSNTLDMIILAHREAITCKQDINAFGLTPVDYKIVVVKLGYLFPDFMAVSKCTIMALTTGSCSQNLTSLSYFKILRPMYPFDTFDWKSR